ncbi:MAG TPA: DUF3293 domain-containing protein [Lysobacter sp.]|nr:DUF3293 domain-containing protein [Lysobacter sp.]
MRELTVVNAVELAAAYAAARYAVVLDGDTLLLQVGRPATDLEAYWPAERYVFITAWNPASEPRSDTANAAADALLLAQIDHYRAARLPAWAESPDGQWREPGWLLADIDGDTSDRLAIEFGQAAILAWRRGEPVRLRMLMEPSPDAGDDFKAACIDWMGSR